MVATDSPLRALTVVRRMTISGAKETWALSATWLVTSLSILAERGTSRVEPALMSMRGGMLFTLRKSASLMPVRRDASVALMVLGAVQAVQLEYWPWLWASKLR